MKKINKKNKYALGSYVIPKYADGGLALGDFAGLTGTAGNMIGQAIGGKTGSAVSGALSGASAGMALGPFGALAGGAIGLATSLIGAGKQRKADIATKAEAYNKFNENYTDQFESNFDTLNENAYGTMSYANGGEVEPSIINIEKGELEINPETGKVIREYKGFNPETGGLYQSHAKKGKDTNNNFVTSTPGNFIITAKEAKNYKDALDNNDVLRKNTILQNIKNYKDRVSPVGKFATGGDVPYKNAANHLPSWDTPFNMAMSVGQGLANGSSPINLNTAVPKAQITSLPKLQLGAPGTGNSSSTGLQKAGDYITKYGPGLLNTAQGLFGKVDQQQYVNPTINPHKSNILNNLPQNIGFEPLRQQVYRNQNVAFNQIDNTTSGSPIARANKTNVFANTQNNLGRLYMDNQIANNQIRGQRANIYQGLGASEMAATDKAQQINLGIYESNLANQAAKRQLLNTGVSQLQQTYQNDKYNDQLYNTDMYKLDLLREMNPLLRFYADSFGKDRFKNRR